MAGRRTFEGPPFGQRQTIAHPSLLHNNSQSHGHMAPSLRRKNLVCFYCNKRSDIKYDGLITQWDCSKCEATNFLDKDGEITDPPVGTENAASNDLKFAISGPEFSSQGSENDLFCSTCLENQHLYTASLAQYYVETDTTHPEYRNLERDYYAFRKALEDRYPQVCVDCEPKVLERMRQAGKTAKADHMRRLMDKSRARKLNTGGNISLAGCLDTAGRVSWYLGLVTQLLWNFTALIIASEGLSSLASESSWISSIMDLTGPILSILEYDWLIKSSLLFTIGSIWWNPMFKQMNRGFMNHIIGFRDWYKLQFLIVLTRSLFYYAMGTGVFADPLSAATTGAHIFLFGFVSFLSFKAQYSLKVDTRPLWATTPERLTNVGPRSSPEKSGNQMLDILNEISSTPSRAARRPPVPLAQPSSGLESLSLSATGRSLQRVPAQPLRNNSLQIASTQPPRNNLLVQRRNTPSLLDMTELESRRYLETGEIPARLQNQPDVSDQDEMEWTPSQTPVSQFRAFNSSRPLPNKPQQFGETPVGDQPSPFWFKVPPAPVGPERKLRNPPNQPRLRMTSPAEKNIFSGAVEHNFPQNDEPPLGNEPTKGKKKGQRINFAEQKFFAPVPQNEAGNILADLLTSFTLSSPDQDSPQAVQSSPAKIHAWQGTALMLGLFLWHHTYQDWLENAKIAQLMVMIGCAGIGANTVLDNIIRAGQRKHIWKTLGALMGASECVAACYGILEILAGRGGCESCASMGTVLMGGLLLQEIWLASFGL